MTLSDFKPLVKAHIQPEAFSSGVLTTIGAVFNKTAATRIQRDLEQDKQQTRSFLKCMLLIKVQKFPQSTLSGFEVTIGILDCSYPPSNHLSSRNAFQNQTAATDYKCFSSFFLSWDIWINWTILSLCLGSL